MSGTYQNVIICGNLARDVEVRNFANGGKVANMTVVTNENWKTKEGEKERGQSFTALRSSLKAWFASQSNTLRKALRYC